MNSLVTLERELTMSSLEIAKLTGKQHKNVLADIRKMLAEIGSAEKSAQYKDVTGRSLPMLLLNKEEALCLVSGYNVKMRMAIIKRWQELEAQNTIQLPNFNNPAESARAWADQFEARQVAEQKLAEAKPKLEFVEKYVEADQLFTFRQVCKLLGANERDFRAFLASEGVMYKLGRDWAAYAQHLTTGRFQVRTGIAKNGAAYSATYFTSKGVEWIAGKWAKHKLK